METIETVKEYLKSLTVILRGMKDPTGMNAKTSECIELLLEHCEALEMKCKATLEKIHMETKKE